MLTPKAAIGKTFFYFSFLSLIILFLIVSCRKIDAVDIRQRPTVNLETRFFSEHIPNDPFVKSVLGFVKRENEKKHFVANLINKIGYPYWDKALVAPHSRNGRIASDSVNTVYIPFVIDDANTVNTTLIVRASPSDTNFLLLPDWKYADQPYGSPEVDSTAENVSLLFMLEDRSVFGYDRFKLTDNNLFSSMSSPPGFNGREIRINNNSNGRTALEYEVEVCFNTYVCPYQGGPGSYGTYCLERGYCDYGSCVAQNGAPVCYLEVSLCWTYLYNVDEGLWSTGGGGGPEGGQYGGSGAGWNSWDPPICEEEPQGRTTTYQDCGPGWTPPGINVPILYDPCAETQAGAANATSLSQTANFLSAKSNVQTTGIADNLEHSITFGRDGTNNITTSSMSTGSSNNASVNTNWPGAFADIHNHNGNSSPSPGDFYGLVETNQNHSGYDTRFVVTSGGAVYALLVVDLAKAFQWITENPKEQITGFPPSFPVAIADYFAEAKSYMVNIMNIDPLIADEMAMALVLEKYDTGIALLKQNSNGDFKRLLTTETTSGGTTTYTANNCQ